MQLFLFISGKAFSGKDTFYETLKTMYPNVKQSAFAMEVKKEFCRLNPEIKLADLLADNSIKAKCRGGLIEIGDGYREKYGDGIWIDKHYDGLKESGAFEEDFSINCITDTRYYNENHIYPQAIMKNNPRAICLRIRIHAGLTTRLERMGNAGAINYIKHGLFSRSECELDEYRCDFNFHNGVNFKDHWIDEHDDGSTKQSLIQAHFRYAISTEIGNLLTNVLQYKVA